ncbi:polysaccharide deacetylase family protein [Sulfurovum sp. XGS-02]|uniref:polysaccharide deacetylase family protein n=1 Tax=Sulfurovum sp. XGS-02 TaxID=2925411 RepID=UPI002058E6CF|nr:polysaccharide deacetylase family protein [Sulfurovum sp. XGS-02]UPT77640.1 polysaccharide deacetylase family protein [Sulfurovum sp. XGS-02]
MIKIAIPNNNIKERKYILNAIFNEFLGVSYEIVISKSELMVSCWNIELENGSKLTFEDHFFSNYPHNLEYLKFENIPSTIEFAKNKFIVDVDIPIIYGNANLNIRNSELSCGIDIFASSFFMLTRWEEYVNKNRDVHDRFPANESLAFKNGFLDRPVVNEYLEMLKNMLFSLDTNLKFKIYNYKLLLTHDVDSILKYPNFTSGIKEITGDFIKRRNIQLAIDNLVLKIKTTLKIKKDPFDTFDYLMDISEKIGGKSYFFFMGNGVTKFDNMYKSDDGFVQSLVKKIKQRGHHIGIHPTYSAYNDFEQFKKEKQELQKKLDTEITFGREHYLRFEVPTTWQIWEDNGMEWDSTLSYPDKEGFRCGVCYAYSVFNVLTRKQLNLKERPLIVMDGSFSTYQPNIKPSDMENKITYLMQKVKKYNGEFVFLWHNSSFNIPQWKKYQSIYERVLK